MKTAETGTPEPVHPAPGLAAYALLVRAIKWFYHVGGGAGKHDIMGW